MVLSSSTIDLWVVALEKGSHAVQLRMLLTLKNCIRCEKSSLSSRPLNVVSQLLHASSSRKFLKQIESCTNGSSSVNDSNSYQQMEDQIKKTAIEIRKLLTA
jgi:hypothetical protein